MKYFRRVFLEYVLQEVFIEYLNSYILRVVTHYPSARARPRFSIPRTGQARETRGNDRFPALVRSLNQLSYLKQKKENRVNSVAPTRAITPIHQASNTLLSVSSANVGLKRDPRGHGEAGGYPFRVDHRRASSSHGHREIN